MSVPADELFAFNSASLLAGADGVLSPLASRARAQHRAGHHHRLRLAGRWVGRLQPGLSKDRARAVRNRLVALGLPLSQISQVTGLGTAGQPPRACDLHGQLDEAICAGLRRVVILLIPHTAAAS